MTTLNNIIDALDTFVLNHKQLKAFYAGSVFEFNAASNLYPALVADTNPAIIQRGMMTVSFNILIMDLVNKDNSNVEEIHSDTLQIFGDLFAMLQSKPGFMIGNTATMTLDPFNHQSTPTDDIVAGWSALVTFEFPFAAGQCNVPTK